MLKLALIAEEGFGHRMLLWWNGEGAARVLKRLGRAALIELADAAVIVPAAERTGSCEQFGILCSVAERLHGRKAAAPWGIRPLAAWFVALETMATTIGGPLRDSAVIARKLFAAGSEAHVLHGDLHGDNVLFFGDRGWLAIDPKGFVGERVFDFVPMLTHGAAASKLTSEDLAARCVTVAGLARVEWTRLAGWSAAYSGLSLAWSLQDNNAGRHEWREVERWNSVARAAGW
jgi:streptomycin 6-kinase